MADLKIYNNGENKILFSAGDRIIRQPYEFARGFEKVPNVYLKLDIGGLLNQDEGWTVLSWLNGQQTTGESCHLCIRTNLYAYRWSVTDSGLSLLRRDTTSLVGGWNMLKPELYGISTDIMRTGLRIVDPGAMGNVNDILIGAYSTTPAGAVVQSNPGGRNDELFIFNRTISEGEYRYIYQNGIGSEAQTQSGLVGRYNFNVAEIIDNGSGNAVVIRNISTHNNALKHIDYIGLPAGTLQEQLDYANQNTLKVFRE